MFSFPANHYFCLIMITLSFIGLAQSIFASLILLTRKLTKLADYILITWLFIIALNFCIPILRDLHFFSGPFEVLFILAHGPMLFLYAQALMEEGECKFQPKKLWHLSPFLFFTLIFTSVEALKGEGWLLEFLTLREELHPLLWLVFSYSVFGVFVGYTYKLQKLLRTHRRRLKEHFSYESQSINLKWLMVISSILCVGYLFFLSMGTIALAIGYMPVPALFFINVSLTLICYAVSYYGVKQPCIFFYQKEANDPRYDTEKPIQTVPDKKDEQQKYARSGLKKEESNILENKLKFHMDREQPFLKGNLTIQDVANAIEVPRHYLTQVINEQLNMNFYSFVNNYRLEEFKKRIIDKKYDNLTILAIAYDCGFNSKSTFNTFFKQNTGMTPTQYKKEQMNNDIIS